MKDYIEIRCLMLADYICAYKATVRDASKVFGVSKSTVTLLTQKLVIEAQEDKLPEITKAIRRIVKKLEPDVAVIEK